MPIRTSSLTKRIADNGAMLHQARMGRIHAQGADQEPSDAEKALAEERRLLKEERAKRHEAAEHPKPKASTLVRTHHAEAKHKDVKPKVKKEKEAKPVAKGAHKQTRAEKHATKAAALEAAKRAAKKSAKT